MLGDKFFSDVDAALSAETERIKDAAQAVCKVYQDAYFKVIKERPPAE